MMKTAPIALFVYNRPKHLQKTIIALQKNELAAASDLFIFADGLRHISHEEGFRQVQNILKQNFTGFRKVEICYRPKNYGLAQNIMSGVSQLIEQYGEIIVLEDDMVTSPFFLRYMNQALQMYHDCDEVISIHGYIYPVQQSLPETFFLRGADCWGWATWQRGWALFEADGTKLLKELRMRKLTYEFDFDNTYPYTKMLLQQIAGKNDSWAIRWYASAFLHNKLTLYPGRSLIHNIGNDGGGVHAQATECFTNSLLEKPLNVVKLYPIENEQARHAVVEFFRALRPSLYIRFISLVRRLLNLLKYG